MKRTLLIPLLALIAGAAQAADATTPVREIMAEAENGWSETPVGEPRDYFDDERLGRIYSQDFVRAYRDAARFPAFEDGDRPLDYDPIVSGQDSCALRDIKITPTTPANGHTDVTVTFDNVYCLDDADGVQDAAGAQDAPGAQGAPGAQDTARNAPPAGPGSETGPDANSGPAEIPKRQAAVLHFIVTEEKGRFVIDDILRAGQEGSLKAELASIAAQGAAGTLPSEGAKGAEGAE